MTKKCGWCGEKFEAKTNREKYCNKECARHARVESQVAYQKRRAANIPKLIRKCEMCGEEFVVGRGNAKTCSEACRTKYQQHYWEKYYLVHKDVVMRECVVCKKTFERKGNFQVCSENCRTVRDEQKAKDFYEKYKPIARQKKKEWKARIKAEEPLVEAEHRVLDGKVLHKAQMTVDEYNKAHGTNYSYGMYVHYVETMSQKAESQSKDECIEEKMLYLRDVKKLSWTAIATKVGHGSGDACRIACERYLKRKGVKQ